MVKNDDICSMTKSEERAFEILKSQLDTEKRERLSEQKKRRAAELRSEGYEKELSELRRQLTSKIDDQSTMLSQLTQFLMGNGAVSLSDSLKEPIIGSIREEFEKREHALKDANEKRMEEMIDAFNRKLAAKDNEINRLKGRKKGKSSGNEGDMTGSIKADEDDMTPGDKLKQSEQQKANVQTTAYGQHTECTRYNHGCQQTEDADTMDLNGETVPDEMISNIANRIKAKKDMKGISTPRREQPLAEIAKGAEDEITLTPENVPANAEELKPDVTVRYSWVEGYIRVTRIVRRKFKLVSQDFEYIRLQRVLQISPLFNDFKSKLEVLSEELDPKKEPELLKAVNYALKELPCMLRCLESGELDLSNNVCERQIRRITKYRNNSFFVGSPEAGVDFARLQSLFANIKNHTLNGMEYICDIFRRIKDTSEEEMENLLAHKWQPSRILSNQF